MPPKKKSEPTVFTILKLKRQTTTYILTIDPTAATPSDIKTQLSYIIQQLGGISNAGAVSGEDVDIVDDDEEDIEVPKSEFIDEDVEEPKEEEVEVDVGEIRLGIPKDASDPYANDWTEVKDDEDMSELGFKDYDILAFAYGQDDVFEIVEPTVEEN